VKVSHAEAKSFDRLSQERSNSTVFRRHRKMSSDSEDVDINYVTMHLLYALKPVTIHAEMCFRNIFHRISE